VIHVVFSEDVVDGWHTLCLERFQFGTPGRELASAAMHADARQTESCAYLSAILLGRVPQPLFSFSIGHVGNSRGMSLQAPDYFERE